MYTGWCKTHSFREQSEHVRFLWRKKLIQLHRKWKGKREGGRAAGAMARLHAVFTVNAALLASAASRAKEWKSSARRTKIVVDVNVYLDIVTATDVEFSFDDSISRFLQKNLVVYSLSLLMPKESSLSRETNKSFKSWSIGSSRAKKISCN